MRLLWFDESDCLPFSFCKTTLNQSLKQNAGFRLAEAEGYSCLAVKFVYSHSLNVDFLKENHFQIKRWQFLFNFR